MSRSFTTSCSTFAAPSVSSWPCARSGRTPTCSPRSTTRREPRAASPHRNVHTTFLQRLNPTSRTFRALLPFYPAAIESLDLSDYDLVVSSSSAWAQGVISGPGRRARLLLAQPVPLRLERPRPDAGRAPRPGHRAPSCRGLFHRWRQWDWIAAQRVDHYVANSRVTQSRIRSYFGRESTIVHPPVRDLALRAGRGARLLPRAVRADAAQADRPGRARVQPAASCRW